MLPPGGYRTAASLMVILVIGLIVYWSHVTIVQTKPESPLQLSRPEQLQPDRSESNPLVIETATNFEECVAAGNLLLLTYPSKCITAGGKTFINPAVQRVKLVKVEIEQK